jgi:hypothetical protein
MRGMNTTKEAIKIMQAYVDGVTCQSRPYGVAAYSAEQQGAGMKNQWTTLLDPLWNWEDYEYRLKPSMVIKGGVYTNGDGDWVVVESRNGRFFASYGGDSYWVESDGTATEMPNLVKEGYDFK